MTNEIYTLSFAKIMFPKIIGRYIEDHPNCTAGKQAVHGAESDVNITFLINT